MNTGRVKAAADVIFAAQKQGQVTASGWAYALESAQLLMSPELAAELESYRALELGAVDGRVSAACGQPHHPTWLRAKDDERGCPWCALDEAHDELIGANLARWEEEQDNARLGLAWQSARCRAWEKREELEALRSQAAELAGLRARDVLLHTILDGWREGRLTAEQVALGLQSTLMPESVPQPDGAS